MIFHEKLENFESGRRQGCQGAQNIFLKTFEGVLKNPKKILNFSHTLRDFGGGEVYQSLKIALKWSKTTSKLA